MLKLLALPLIIPAVLAQSFEYATRFPQNKLYSLDQKTIGLEDFDGTIAAFGDFNGDKFTDLFVLSSDQSSISVYTWNHQNFRFVAPEKAQIKIDDLVITNIVPGDYNYDGLLDVLVMSQEDASNKADGEIVMRVYTGNGNDTFVRVDAEYIQLPSAQGPLPMVLDITGNMKPDLLGYAWGQGTDKNELNMWINKASPSNASDIYESVFDAVTTGNCKWAHPHSNAFLDLDGDCLADLVFVCEEKNNQKRIQLWTNQRQDGFKLSQSLSLPDGAGPLSFADIDGDGSIDILFPVCHGSTCKIHVVYNNQMGLCSTNQDPGTPCRKAQDLCVADPGFTFDFDNPQSEHYVVFDIDAELDEDEYIQMEDALFRGKLPVAIHPGDYNLDGYPDLLVTTNKRAILLESIICTTELCSKKAASASKRSFSIVKTGNSALSDITRPSQAVFFDIDENGSLDMIVLQSTGKKGADRIPKFVINNYFNDAFFLKGLACLVSNGVCSSYCPVEPALPNLKPYGVSYPGATFKFTVLDTSGVKRVHQVSQLSQSAYMPLQTPYCLFGLGRTNNYVEEMFAGVTRHQEHNYLFYEGVIPNSQLIFIPYQPEDVKDSSSWKVELYIQPADYVPWVLVALIAAACGLGIVVGALYWAEKREDETERRKALHIINFDAL
ncbi:hypothetical protein CLU79DRAFT_881311 [Phycomyces nitens]|nr:hypothetical protein CLU79DRAFT_881311 [Phycomyces nitens]